MGKDNRFQISINIQSFIAKTSDNFLINDKKYYSYR